MEIRVFKDYQPEKLVITNFSGTHTLPSFKYDSAELTCNMAYYDEPLQDYLLIVRCEARLVEALTGSTYAYVLPEGCGSCINSREVALLIRSNVGGVQRIEYRNIPLKTTMETIIQVHRVEIAAEGIPISVYDPVTRKRVQKTFNKDIKKMRLLSLIRRP